MTPRHEGYNVCTPVHIPGNAARTIICRKWNVSQGQKEAIIIDLYVWVCSMSVPMMEAIVEQIRDKDQICCFWHWSLGKTIFNVEQ